MSKAAVDEPWWQDANVGTIATPTLRLVAPTIFAWQSFAERRRARRPLLDRVRAWPPPEPDAA